MDIFDFVDRELKNRHISRREFAKAIGAPESSLATAFSRKNVSFFLKNDYIDKTAEFLRIPIWSFFVDIPEYNAAVQGGQLVNQDKQDVIFDSVAYANLLRYEDSTTVLNVLLRELGFRDFLNVIGDAIIAKQENNTAEIHSAMYVAHKRLEELFEDLFYKEPSGSDSQE